jgi:hypothetical protein
MDSRLRGNDGGFGSPHAARASFLRLVRQPSHLGLDWPAQADMALTIRVVAGRFEQIIERARNFPALILFISMMPSLCEWPAEKTEMVDGRMVFYWTITEAQEKAAGK